MALLATVTLLFCAVTAPTSRRPHHQSRAGRTFASFVSKLRRVEHFQYSAAVLAAGKGFNRLNDTIRGLTTHLAPRVQTPLDRAGQWFLHSGIQEASGGVARYHLLAEGRNARVSTEITGYAAGALVYLYRCTGETEYLRAAERAGEFLCRRAWNAVLEVMPFEYGPGGGHSQELSYFFDCGIIARGLLALWRNTGRNEFLEGAQRCGDSMARDFTAADAFHPILQLPGKQPLPYGARWSNQPGCYQLKSAMAWHELFVATGESQYEHRYEEAVHAFLQSHAAFLPGASDQAAVMDRLHAYCYFLEGLLPVAHQSAVREALAQGIQSVSRHLRSIRPVFERSDVCAQLLRVRLYADRAGAVPLDQPAAAEEFAWLQSYQADGGTGNRAERNGYYFGRRDGCLLPYSNPVSTAFALQAAEMWRQHGDAAVRPLNELI